MAGSTISLGGLPTTSPTDAVRSASILLWGMAGFGKTTLAMTAPGDILLLQFDQTGAVGMGDKVINAGKEANIYVSRLMSESDSIIDKFTQPNPLGLEKTLTDNPNIQTVVFDSLSSFGDKALSYAVLRSRASKKGMSASLEDPGRDAYGRKRTFVERAVRNIATSCIKCNVHCIFIAHEGPPVTNNQGEVVERTLSLGSSLNLTVPREIGEIWYLSDTGRERRLYIRNSGVYRPMRSRMFATENIQHFKLNFDADKWQGTGIADWIEAWKANDFKKINPPKE